MLKKSPQIAAQDELFKVRLENVIEPRHALVKLAERIDWDGLEADLSVFYCTGNGRPGGALFA
jgi:IS5 family transposase